MNTHSDIRRAAEALSRATEAGPDDLVHPGYDELEAYVDGQLDAVAREIVDTHVGSCRTCAEDLADLQAMKAALPAAHVSETSSASNVTMPWVRVAQIAAAIVVVAGGALAMRQWIQANRVSTPETAAIAAAIVVVAAGATGAGLTADERAFVDGVLTARALVVPAVVRGLAAPVGTLLGASAPAATLSPLTPTATAVASATPQFTWRGVPGAQGYTVAVFDGSFNEVARSPRQTGTSWTPSAPLPRGAVLAWQITAHLSGRDVLAPEPPQPEARFLVVDEETAKTLEEQETRLQDQPLALGVLLARAGLVSDAARELSRAAAQPDLAEQASALIKTLKR